MNSATLEQLANNIDESFFLVGAALLGIELAKGLFTRNLKWQGMADMLSSLSTQIPFILIETFILSSAYGVYVLVHDHYIPWSMDINITNTLLAVLMADFLYYWEHRCAHLVRILWIQHAVHHSSRYMNIITGVRFGPLEGIWSMLVLFPMVIIGFPPELILFGSLVVLAYQTWIHTELIGKLGLLEWFLNTPSHHRVHHGCNDQYLDKNYGGILIIWDRLFGSFQEEEETPNYGLARDFNSVNPIKVWFSEWPALYDDLRQANSFKEIWQRLFNPPGWQPLTDKTSHHSH